MESWSTLARQSERTLRSMQLRKLKSHFRHVLPFQPFVQSHPQKEDYVSVGSLDDFRKLPFTSKLDLIPTETNPARSRDFILQPDMGLIKKYFPKLDLIKLIARKITGTNVKKELEWEYKPIHVHFTTGRSASQIPFLYSEKDLDTLSETGNRIFETIGGTTDDVIINGFPFAPHLAFWFAAFTTRKVNVLGLHTGGGKVMGTQKIIDAIERLKGTILIIMPGYGYHLLREAVEQKRDFSSLRIVLFGGERVSPGMRTKVKKMLHKLGAKNAKVLATYAFTEAKTAWVQCHEDSGYHLYPDLELIELVDSQGRPVKEGSSGEVTYTSLGWRGSVVTRYKTGDFCKSLITSTSCKYCGRTVSRLHSSIERRSDMMELNLTKIKGELVNLNTLHSIMHEIPSVEEWQAEIVKRNNDPFEVDELRLSIAFEDGKSHSDDLILLQQMIYRDFAISADIVIRPLKEIILMLGLETELKEKRIVDRRKEAKK